MKDKPNKDLKIDAVKMMCDIRSAIYEETKNMTFEERREYYKSGSGKSSKTKSTRNKSTKN